MTVAEFKSEIKNGLSGGYLLCGEEAYLRRHYMAQARSSVVADPNDVFNHITLNGDSYSLEALSDAIQALPVFSEKKLIEVSGVCFSEMSADGIQEFCDVVSTLPEYEYNVLLVNVGPDELDPGTEKRYSKLLKELSGYLKPIIFERETPGKLAKWVKQHFTSKGIFISSESALEIVKFCGDDMYNLSGEVDKLISYTLQKGSEKFDEKDIPYISSRTNEIQAFDLANAVLDGNSSLAYSILYELKMKKERPEMILSGISRVICDLAMIKSLSDSGIGSREAAQKLKMHEYKASLYYKSAAKCTSAVLDNAIELCHDADIKIKNTQLDSYNVLDSLVASVSKRS